MTSTRTHPYAIPQFKLVNDLTGSDRFFQQVPINALHNLLSECTLIVLSLLYPPEYSADASTLPGGITTITLFLEDFEGVAFTCNNEVHFSTSYINSIDSARVLHEIRGVIVHEFVHVFQYNGNSTVPGGVIEGIADWVRLLAGLDPPHWRKGSGERWDQGYDATAFFLQSLAATLGFPSFVPTLNLKLKYGEWDKGELLRELIGGRDVEDMWREYKRLNNGGTASNPIPTHQA